MKTVKIFGAPGCGKTETLLNIMERELERGVRPDRLAYLTFTVRARQEAIERVERRFGYTQDDLPYFRTLHSIAYRQLDLSSAALLRDSDLEEFSDLVQERFSPQRGSFEDEGLPLIGGGKLRGDRLIAFDHVRRQRMQTVEQAHGEWEHYDDYLVVERFCLAYEDWKRREGILDFTDLLERVDTPLPVETVLVDEAQDLSRRQWATLDVFAAQAERAWIAGDDDQAIFTWAGADPHEFLERPGKVEVLDRSYRLSRAIFDLARHLAGRISRRQEKQITPREAPGEVDLMMGFFQATVDQIDLEESTLILYRNHYLANDIILTLMQRGVPFEQVGGRPAPAARWGPSLFFWERLRRGQRVSASQVRRTLEAMLPGGRTLARGGRAIFDRLTEEEFTLEDLRREHVVKADEPWFDALDQIPDEEVEYLRRVIQHHGSAALSGEPPVRLSTIHAAKGAEADHVILLTQVSRQVRRTIDRDPDSELRVFYVGVTRARDRLTLIGADNPFFYPEVIT